MQAHQRAYFQNKSLWGEQHNEFMWNLDTQTHTHVCPWFNSRWYSSKKSEQLYVTIKIWWDLRRLDFWLQRWWLTAAFSIRHKSFYFLLLFLFSWCAPAHLPPPFIFPLQVLLGDALRPPAPPLLSGLKDEAHWAVHHLSTAPIRCL